MDAILSHIFTEIALSGDISEDLCWQLGSLYPSALRKALRIIDEKRILCVHYQTLPDQATTSSVPGMARTLPDSELPSVSDTTRCRGVTHMEVPPFYLVTTIAADGASLQHLVVPSTGCKCTASAARNVGTAGAAGGPLLCAHWLAVLIAEAAAGRVWAPFEPGHLELRGLVDDLDTPTQAFTVHEAWLPPDDYFSALAAGLVEKESK